MEIFGKVYFDNLMNSLGVVLDEEQRAAIMCDAPHLLIVAGAGAGKTTTMVAKAKYLVDSGKAKPDEILIISFTNNAVEEFKEHLQQLDSKVHWNVSTFHKLGYKISNQADPKSYKIIDSGAHTIILDSFKKLIKDQKFAEDVTLFFGSYFGNPFEDVRTAAKDRYFVNNQTLKSCIEDLTTQDINNLNKQKISIKYENLRSHEEVEIANYLYLHGIEYTYEKEYPYQEMENHRPYTPDFYIKQGDIEAYIEHFGVSEDGTSDRYKDKVLARYLEHMQIKKACHQKHRTHLITTYSSYKDNRITYLTDLENQLKFLGFQLMEPNYVDVCQHLVDANVNQQLSKFTHLIERFICLFKSKNYSKGKFDEWIEKHKDKPRYWLFLEICKRCYIEYEDSLQKNDLVDFEDMINKTKQALKKIKHFGKKNPCQYKYILIDEYQDISRNRLNFVKLLSDYYEAKVIAVGDDWQTIFGYAGADDSLFSHFKEDFVGAKEMLITNTYRNSKELIDMAGDFVMKNRTLIKKSLKSSKSIDKPIYVYAYNEFGDNGKTWQRIYGETVEQVLYKLKADYPNADWSREKILLLGRFGFDGRNLKESGRFEYVHKNSTRDFVSVNPNLMDMHLEFLTVHKAKGLTYDHVVILNARDDIFGFPSQVMNEPIMNLVIKAKPSDIKNEERRLFYVALTRTKNRVYIMTPRQRSSEFVVELMNNYRSHIESNEDAIELKEKQVHRCPICNAPLQFRKSNISRYTKDGAEMALSLWECANDPEACGFMTNNLQGGILSIERCPTCDGYMIVRNKEDNYFLGCTNYHNPQKQCKETISLEQYVGYIDDLWDLSTQN